VAIEVESLVRLAEARGQEIDHLVALRNTLLPELLSGRLRVKDAEKVVEEAV
jgi:type I restriction enzyme S subunit